MRSWVGEDHRPRPGAGGSLVAFIHPSAAQGVLVELKQRAGADVRLDVKHLTFGDLRLTVLHDGPFRLDGGAMFGVVPRPLWEKLTPPDERNRIQLAMRPLLVEATWGRMIVDCGAGDKMAAKQMDRQQYAEPPRNPEGTLFTPGESGQIRGSGGERA